MYVYSPPSQEGIDLENQMICGWLRNGENNIYIEYISDGIKYSFNSRYVIEVRGELDQDDPNERSFYDF